MTNESREDHQIRTADINDWYVNLLTIVATGIFAVFIIQYAVFYINAEIVKIISTYPDDAYYYFEVGKNISELGWPTFDGINATNGFHPVYMLVVSVVFELADGRFAPLRYIGLITTISMLITFFIVWAYLRKRFNRSVVWLSLLGVLYYINYMIKYGMETTVLLPLLALSLYLFAEWEIYNFETVSRNKLLVFGTVLGLVHIARLDAVLFSLLAVIVIIHKNRDRLASNWRSLGYIIAPPTLTGFGYLLTNIYIFGHFSPASGKVKSMNAAGVNLNLIEMLSPLSNFNLLDGVTLALLACVLLCMIIIFWSKYAQDYDFELTSQLVAVFTLAHLCYYLLFYASTWAGWYYYPYIFVAGFILPELLQIGYVRFSGCSWIDRVQLERTIMLVVAISLLFFSGVYLPSDLDNQNDRGLNNYQLAQHTNQNYEPTKTFAMGDTAGRFGYFSHNSVVHTEGLVNNHEFIQILRKNRLNQYLTQNDIDYIILPSNQVNPNEGYDRSEVRISHLPSISHVTVTVVEKCEVSRYPPNNGFVIYSWDCIEYNESK